MEWGKGTPKEREVNRRREVCEWEGRVCAREAGAPSMLRLIRKAVALARMLPNLVCVCCSVCVYQMDVRVENTIEEVVECRTERLSHSNVGLSTRETNKGSTEIQSVLLYS